MPLTKENKMNSKTILTDRGKISNSSSNSRRLADNGLSKKASKERIWRSKGKRSKKISIKG